MKFAVIGNGKTGSKVVECLSEQEISGIYTSKNPPGVEELKQADVAIVFVTANVLEDILDVLVESKIPVICGTTGYEWTDELDRRVRDSGCRWIVGNNFSLGMNMLYYMAGELRHIGGEATVGIHDIHHIHKVDRPSGSAKELQKILAVKDDAVTSERLEDVKGTHRVRLEMPGEVLELSHIVDDRRVFAQGAIEGAKYLEGIEAGIHHFREILHKQWSQERNLISYGS